MSNLFSLALGVLATGASAQAGLILHVNSATVAPSASDQTVQLDVWLEETSEGEDIWSYTIPLRLQANGPLTFTGSGASTLNHPSVFTDQPAPNDNTGYPGGDPSDDNFIGDPYNPPKDMLLTGYATTNGQQAFYNVDIVNSGDNQREGLFSVFVNVPANTALGSYTVQVDEEFIGYEVIDLEGNKPVVEIREGLVTVALVPEPSAMAVGLVALPLLARRRRR